MWNPHWPDRSRTNILEHDVQLAPQANLEQSVPLELEHPEEKHEFLGRERSKLVAQKWKSLAKKIIHAKLGQTPIIAWLSLVVGLLTVCTVGPVFKKLGLLGVSVSLRPCWRSQITLAILAIPAFLELKKIGPEMRRIMFTRENFLLYLGCSSTWSISMIVWLRALDFTSIPRASLFTNSYPIILVIWYKFRRVPLSTGEVVGTLIGFLGVGVTMAGGFGSGFSSSELIGDGLCLGVAAVNAAGVIWGSRLRQRIQLFTYTFFTTLFLAFVTGISSLAFEGANFGAFGPHGLFAWVQPEFVFLAVFSAVAVGVIGVMAYNYALKHVPPLAYSVFKLLDPPFTGILAVFLGLDDVPSVWTFVGGVLTLLGIFVVQYGLQKRLQADEEHKYNRMDAKHPALQVEIESVELSELKKEEKIAPSPKSIENEGEIS